MLGAGDSPDVRWTRTGKHWTFEVERMFELPVLFISNCPSLSLLILLAMNSCLDQVLHFYTELV